MPIFLIPTIVVRQHVQMQNGTLMPYAELEKSRSVIPEELEIYAERSFIMKLATFLVRIGIFNWRELRAYLKSSYKLSRLNIHGDFDLKFSCEI